MFHLQKILKEIPLKKNLSSNKTSIKDPFLVQSIEKHVFKITLKGEFNNLLNFLKELELLQAIAITDNIEIKPNSVNAQKDKFKLIMDFDLSTYAKVDTNN